MQSLARESVRGNSSGFPRKSVRRETSNTLYFSNGRLQLQEDGDMLLLECDYAEGEARRRRDSRSSDGHGIITRSRSTIGMACRFQK